MFLYRYAGAVRSDTAHIGKFSRQAESYASSLFFFITSVLEKGRRATKGYRVSKKSWATRISIIGRFYIWAVIKRLLLGKLQVCLYALTKAIPSDTFILDWAKTKLRTRGTMV